MSIFYSGSDSLAVGIVGNVPSSFPQNDAVWYRYVGSWDTSSLLGKILSNVCKKFSVVTYGTPLTVILRSGFDLLGPAYNVPSVASNFNAHTETNSTIIKSFNITSLGDYEVFVPLSCLNFFGNTDLRIAKFGEPIVPPVNSQIMRVGMQPNTNFLKRAKLCYLELFDSIPVSFSSPSEQITPVQQFTPSIYLNGVVKNNFDAQLSVDFDFGQPPIPDSL